MVELLKSRAIPAQPLLSPISCPLPRIAAQAPSKTGNRPDLQMDE